MLLSISVKLPTLGMSAIRHVVFCVWRLLLTLLFLRLICVVVCNSTSFLPECLLVGIGHVVSLRSSLDEHLDCCHVRAIMNNAVTKAHIQVFVWLYVFPSHRYVGIELLGHMATLCLTFRRIAKLFSKVVAPTATYEGSNAATPH